MTELSISNEPGDAIPVKERALEELRCYVINQNTTVPTTLGAQPVTELAKQDAHRIRLLGDTTAVLMSSCYAPPTRAFFQQGRWNGTWSPAPSARRIIAASQRKTLFP